jgi:hypothetical protein
MHTQSSHQCFPFILSCDEYVSFVVEEEVWAPFFPSQAYSLYFYGYVEMFVP